MKYIINVLKTVTIMMTTIDDKINNVCAITRASNATNVRESYLIRVIFESPKHSLANAQIFYKRILKIN